MIANVEERSNSKKAETAKSKIAVDREEDRGDQRSVDPDRERAGDQARVVGLCSAFGPVAERDAPRERLGCRRRAGARSA